MYRPLRDDLIVEVEPLVKTTTSGIILGGGASETNTSKGTVIAAGPGSRNPNGDLIPASVKVGDIVLFHNHNGLKLSEGNSEPVTLLLKEESVLAIVE